MIHTPTRQSGFAMLFTVLIVSLILSIAISISNITLKQAILSNLAKDSQIAFYQADAAVECGLYEDTTMGLFPRGSDANTIKQDVPGFECGSIAMVFDLSSTDDYYVYVPASPIPARPGFTIVFNKTNSEYSKIQGYGYNVWDTNSPRQVERALEVKY